MRIFIFVLSLCFAMAPLAHASIIGEVLDPSGNSGSGGNSGASGGNSAGNENAGGGGADAGNGGSTPIVPPGIAPEAPPVPSTEPGPSVTEPAPSAGPQGPTLPDLGPVTGPVGGILDPVVSPIDSSVSSGVPPSMIQPPAVSNPIDSTLPPAGGAPTDPGVPLANPNPVIPAMPESSQPEPDPASERQNNAAASLQSYAAGDSSIVFKPAEEVEEGSMWGLDQRSGARAPQSSTQFVFTGRVVAVDRYRQTMTVVDRNDRSKTLVVDPNTLSRLRKGSMVQATLQPGREKAESVRQILGG
jgi:hypothetical protein